jgi:hypothetical protein
VEYRSGQPKAGYYKVIGLALLLIVALILSIAFVPSGDTLQDAEHDANNDLVLGVIMLVLIAALVVI